MIARFFEKYPEYVNRTFLSIKVSWWMKYRLLYIFLTMFFFVLPREDPCPANQLQTARECLPILLDLNKLLYRDF